MLLLTKLATDNVANSEEYTQIENVKYTNTTGFKYIKSRKKRKRRKKEAKAALHIIYAQYKKVFQNVGSRQK